MDVHIRESASQNGTRHRKAIEILLGCYVYF